MRDKTGQQRQSPGEEPQPGGQGLPPGPRDAEHLDGARDDSKLNEAVARQREDNKRKQSRPQG